jgi:hypothetical protein
VRQVIFILSGVLVAAVIATGCGGGDDAGTAGTSAGSTAGTTSTASADSGEPLTKEAAIKAGDRICGRVSRRIVTELQRHKTEYGRGFGAQPTEKQNQEGVVDLVLPQIEKEANELAALDVPAADEKEMAALVAALRKGVAETEADPAKALSGPNPLDEAAALSRKYGFKVCGS